MPERKTDESAPRKGQASGDGPDVYLNVPLLKVEEIAFEVDNLEAHVSLNAAVLDLLKLNVGADVFLGKVNLEIKGVEAQALLEVRLDNVAVIIERVLTTLDRNPEILQHVGRGVESAARGIGGGAGEAVGEVGKGAGEAVGEVGKGAGEAVGEVGKGAGEAVAEVGEGVGEGAGEAVGGLGKGAGEAVQDLGKGVGQGAGEAVGELGKDAGGAVRGVGEGAGRAASESISGVAEGTGKTVGEAGQEPGDAGTKPQPDDDDEKPQPDDDDDDEGDIALHSALRNAQESIDGLGRALRRMAAAKTRTRHKGE